MLTFKSINNFKRGELGNIILRSYADLVNDKFKCWGQEKKKWDDFDKKAFAIPAIGKCVFVTCEDDALVGLASYDPRIYPEYGIIGQNCILPEYRGKGYGFKQLQEVLRIFQENKVRKAKVTTSAHPFFQPAQNLYKSLGFNEIKRRGGGPDARYKLIDFEKILINS